MTLKCHLLAIATIVFYGKIAVLAESLQSGLLRLGALPRIELFVFTTFGFFASLLSKMMFQCHFLEEH